jgi:RNA polymerase sigma-70 factor (ECF subfamily)
MDQAEHERLQRGDESAFRQLVEATSPWVYALAWRLSDDDTVAEEVMQEAYVQAWRGLAQFRGESRVETWLHAIVVRVARRHWRGEARRRRREEQSAREVSAATGPDDLPLIDLDAAIRELPPRTRMAVVLVCIEGYSHGAAAAMMGTAEGTVKAQVHKGRQLLRERLER